MPKFVRARRARPAPYRRPKAPYSRRLAASKIQRAFRARKARRIVRRPGRKLIGKSRFVMYNRLLQHKVRTKLVYCDTKQLAASAGAVRHKFRLNSIFDPDFDGVGHQPAFHDKWALLYHNYRVTYVKWHITFAPMREIHTVQIASSGTALGQSHGVSDTNHADQSFNPGVVFWEVTDSGEAQQTQAADKNVLRETGRSKNNVAYRMTSGAPYKIYKLSGRTSMRAVMDGPGEYNEHTQFGANPAKQVYLHVGHMSKDGNTTSKYRFDIRMEFFTELTDPINPENQN